MLVNSYPGNYVKKCFPYLTTQDSQLFFLKMLKHFIVVKLSRRAPKSLYFPLLLGMECNILVKTLQRVRGVLISSSDHRACLFHSRRKLPVSPSDFRTAGSGGFLETIRGRLSRGICNVAVEDQVEYAACTASGTQRNGKG